MSGDLFGKVDELKWEYSRNSRLLPVYKIIAALEKEKERLEANDLIAAAYGVKRSIEVISNITWTQVWVKEDSDDGEL